MSVNPRTLAIGKEGGYIAPDYAYIQQKEYSWEEICEHGRQAFRAGDEGTWDGIIWAMKAAEKYDSVEKAMKEYGKEVNKSPRWIQRALQVYKRFGQLRLKYPQLYFEHFRIAVVIADDGKAKEWLDKAADNNWSARRLDYEITKSGQFSKERYKPIGTFKGKLENAEDGYRIYKEGEEEEEFTIVEEELEKLEGKTIKMVLLVKGEGEGEDKGKDGD